MTITIDGLPEGQKLSKISVDIMFTEDSVTVSTIHQKQSAQEDTNTVHKVVQSTNVHKDVQKQDDTKEKQSVIPVIDISNRPVSIASGLIDEEF
jgi:hypothetical protein